MNSKNKSFRPFLALLLTLAMVLGSVGGFGSGKAVKAAGEAKLTIQASKTLDGKAPAADQFEFQILGSDNNEVKTAKNDATGNVVFDALTFSAAGTYTYTVKEKMPAGVDANNTKDGIKYDDSEKTVVVVVENNQVSKVTVDNVEVAVESAPGNAAVNTLGSGDVTAANNTVFALNASGYPDYGMGNLNEKQWFKQTIGNMMAFCIDDGAKTPNDVGNGGNAYTVFDPSEAPDLTDDTIKTIKKLLYYGAPYDSGTGALTQLIMDLGTSMGLTEYSNLSVAKSDLEYFTTQILKDITNEAQGLIDPQEDKGIVIPISGETIERHVIGKFIDRQTGDILESDGTTYILDEITSRIWKNVIDPNTDYVADLVTLHYYTDKNNPNPVRQIEYGPYQRIIAAEFPALVSSVTLPAAFANSTVTAPTTGNLIIKKTFAGDLPTANQGALSFTVAGKNAGGEGVNTLTITYADFNNGQYKIENLPAGESYTVTETNAADLNKAYQLQAGSTSSASGTIAAGQDTTLTFTNTYAKKTVDVKVNKTWAGLEESDAPTVTVTLHANGTATDKTAALTKSNTTVSWTGLDAVDASGNAITYTVVEADLEGFTKAQNSSSKTEGALTTVTVNLTNTKDEQEENAAVTVNVEKKWVGPKADAVTVQLMADGKAFGEPVTLNQDNSWKYTWTDLAKTKADGTEIEYKVDEPTVPANYTKTVAHDGNDWTITNTNTETAPEKISVTVEKEWEGEALESVSVQLFADGEAYGDPIILNADNNWTHTWPELDKTQADGTPIDYTVEEEKLDDYTLQSSSAMDDKGNVTWSLVNTKVAPETVNVTAEKIWVGEPAAAISFTLTRNNVAVDTQTLTGEPWTYTWTDLPKVDEKGEAYAYFVEEAAVEGYTMTGGGYTDDGEGNITITIKNTKDVKVKISKVDLVNGKAVSGAKIELMNEAKEVIESWTSGEGPKEFELAPGHYTFREVNAPAGYTRVESVIGFKVNDDGQIILASIEVTPADAVEVNGDTIFLKNELIKENPQTPTNSEEEEEEESSESEEESSSVPSGGEEEEEKPGNSEEEEEENSTEGDEEGSLPGGGEEEEENAVNGESEEAETTVETEPMGTLPAEEEEEGSSVAAETEVPGTTAPTAPDTGDHSHLGLYLGLMGMAATAGIGLLVGTRKTKEEN